MTHPSEPSPFAQSGQRLYDNGYSVIPIMPGAKMPGIVINGEWMLFKGWNKFCLERASEFQVGMWSKWPKAGVGVACGQGLVAIDIDREECMQAILEILPPTPVMKKGAKGLTLFFRGNTEKIRSRNYRTPERIGLLDLLAEGKQTVLPPSIHPETGMAYYWTTDCSLEDIRLEDLPELPDEIAERIAEVLKRFGYEPGGGTSVDLVPVETEFSRAQASNFFRELNEDALANIPAWAPDLQLPKGRFHGRIYRAVAPWRSSGSGRDMARRSPNLSISPGGIEDFGTGDTFTALNVVMKSFNMTDSMLEDAVVWLGERLGYNFGVEINLRNSTKPQLPAAVEQAPSTDVSTEVEPEATAETLEPHEEDFGESDWTPPTPSLADLEALCHLPGLVGEIIEWIVGSATTPSRPLALGPALTLVGTLAGRCTAGPTELRTNLYVVGLAGSGYGKDHGRKCASRLLMEARLDRFRNADSFLSDSGLRKAVQHQPASVSLMDEFGGFIGKIMDRRAGQHLTAMRQMLMGLFTYSGDVYNGSASAAESNSPIYNPCFSIYGTSTPHDFWRSMSGIGVADGFLPRFLVLHAPGKPPARVRPKLPTEPPHRLVEACRALVTLTRTGNLADASTTAVKPRKAEWGRGAQDAYEWWVEEFARRGEKSSPDIEPLWTRAMEIGLKCAHIVALGIDPRNPVVDRDLVEWGAALGDHSVRSCIEQVQDRLASNDRQAEYLKVRRIIKEAGSFGITITALKRAINGEFDTRRFDDIIKQLQDAKQVYLRTGIGPKGGRPSARLYIGQKEN